PSAGVDDGELAAVPFGDELLAVARHTRLLFDDRATAADDPVHQRRLAHVRAADDGNDGTRRAGHVSARIRSAPVVPATSTTRGGSAMRPPSRKQSSERTTSGRR